MPTDEVLRTWGENIRSARRTLTAESTPRRHGADGVMTQAELGQLLDPPVAQSTIARWERGLMEPRRNYKAQLARLLAIDVRMLFPLSRSAA